MEETRIDDPIISLGSQLEKIAELHKKGLIEDAEFQEIRGGIILQMKNSTFPMAEAEKPVRRVPEAKPAQPSVHVSYGELHNRMVDMFSSQYADAGADEPSQIRVMVSQIAEKQLISAGDTSALMTIANIVYDPAFYETDMSDDQMTAKMVLAQLSLSNMNDQMRSRPDASPPAKAIAEVADQSSKKAIAEMLKITAPEGDNQAQEKVVKKQSIWNSFVKPDVKGAFEGCLAGASLHLLALDFADISITAAAAIATVIGAGIQSAESYIEYRSKNSPV